MSNKRLLRGGENRSNKCLRGATAQASSHIATMVRITLCRNALVLDIRSNNCNRSSLNNTNPGVMYQFWNSELSSPRTQVNFPIRKKPANVRQKVAYKLAPF